VSSSPIDDPEYCRKRAQQLRALAAKIGDSDARAQLLEAAADYDRLKKRAEERPKDV